MMDLHILNMCQRKESYLVTRCEDFQTVRTRLLCNRPNTQWHTVTDILVYVSTHARLLTYILVRLHEAAVEGSVAVSLLQQRHNRFGVQLPPHVQVVGVKLAQVGGRGMTFDLAPLSVVGVVPWLHAAQEVHHFGVTAVPGKTGKSLREGATLQHAQHVNLKQDNCLGSQTINCEYLLGYLYYFVFSFKIWWSIGLC